MKLMICGHGRHGKDTVARVFKEHGFSFTGSSLLCAAHVWTMLPNSHEYPTAQHCYEDRHNHRAAWFDAIKEINTPNPAKLAELIFAQTDIYVGMRREAELLASRRLFDLSIWVDACDRLPPEDKSSNEITKAMCDIVIDNNGTIRQLIDRVHRLGEVLNASH